MQKMQEMWVQSLGQEDLLESEWQPTPVSLSGESHRQRSLVGYSPQDCKELDTTEPVCVHRYTHTLIPTHVSALVDSSYK